MNGTPSDAQALEGTIGTAGRRAFVFLAKAPMLGVFCICKKLFFKYSTHMRARGSVVEHPPDKGKVEGSIPSAPRFSSARYVQTCDKKNTGGTADDRRSPRFGNATHARRVADLCRVGTSRISDGGVG